MSQATVTSPTPQIEESLQPPHRQHKSLRHRRMLISINTGATHSLRSGRAYSAVHSIFVHFLALLTIGLNLCRCRKIWSILACTRLLLLPLLKSVGNRSLLCGFIERLLLNFSLLSCFQCGCLLCCLLLFLLFIRRLLLSVGLVRFTHCCFRLFGLRCGLRLLNTEIFENTLKLLIL